MTRTELTAFRLSAHNLDIERRRHVNVPREQDLSTLLNVNGGVGISFSAGMPSL